MITNYISSKRVLSKIMSDLDMGEESVRTSDILEWIGEAILEIGSVDIFEKVCDIVPIVNYRSEIPSYAQRILNIEYSNSTNQNSFIPMTVSSGNDLIVNTDSSNFKSTSVRDEELIGIVKQLYGNTMSDVDALNKLNSDQSAKETIMSLYNSSIYSYNGNKDYYRGTLNGPQYKIMNGSIFTNIRNGFLKINYTRLLLDEDGYPMIPDFGSFETAIFWYVESKLLYPLFRNNKNVNAYTNARNSYNFYARKAYAEIIAPNTDELESIKNQWLSIVPRINSHSNGFGDLSRRQRILF